MLKARAGSSPRTAVLTVANQTLTISQIASPLINNATIDGKNLRVTGINFDGGAVILIDGSPQKTLRDNESPATTLTGKKSGKNIAPGTVVLLQVRNSDGGTSPAFSFSRP